MRRVTVFMVTLALLMMCTSIAYAVAPGFKLGNEVLMSKYHNLIEGKRIGLVTNQSGVTSTGESMIDILSQDKTTNLVALYGPEHGIDGIARAGEHVSSNTHPELGIPVYSLYGSTRMPTAEMLSNIDVLIFDVQDIGARTYTYMSTLNYCMVAAQKYNKSIIVLDRPNPVGGVVVGGPVLEDPYKTFVGVDNLPTAHGMTAGELAMYFNRNIGVDLKVIPMEGYTREMVYEDTGLTWVATSPNIPDMDSVRGYMATGLGEGTGIRQADKFKWIGGNGLDANKFASLLNQAGLPGVTFIPEQKGTAGGVRLNVTNPHTFNPARTGIYALTYAHSLTNFAVPKSGQKVVMFDKIMGTNKIGQYLEQGLTPQEIEARYAPALNKFKEDRKEYLIYGIDGEQKGDGSSSQMPTPINEPITILVGGNPVTFSSAPYIDENNRTMIPLRAVVEELDVQVDWDPDTKHITMVKQDNIVILKIGETMAVVNGEQIAMTTNPVIKNKYTMVPLRYVGEFFNAKVNWDQSAKTVTVN